MKLTLVFLMAAVLYAQPQVTLSTSSPVYPNSTIAVAATLSGSAGANLDAIGLGLPSGSSLPVVGAASTAAGKMLYSNGNTVVLLPPVATPNINTYADGVVASFTYTVPAAPPGTVVPLSLTALGVMVGGSPVAIATPTINLTISVTAGCSAKIQADIAQYLAAPSVALLGQTVLDMAAAMGGGACN